MPAAADAPARGTPVEPVGRGEFETLMAALGPFEPAPVLAVGVSGGPDSMALCRLADQWAKDRGGRVQALIVDHRLRPDSTDEAQRVAGWLAARDIDHAVLTRDGATPTAAIQATARRARHDLMAAYCRDKQILHLLLAHHRDDQAETFLLRLGAASGLDGLAAMAAVVEVRGLRLLRPMLSVPMARLRAGGGPSIDDPSNRDPAFGRTQIRRLLPRLAHEGVTVDRLARTAAALGRGRHVIDGAVARFLAAAVVIHPAGFLRLDGAAYRRAPDAVALRALARMIVCIGGGAYGPRTARLGRLHEALRGAAFSAGRTLGGCRIMPWRDAVLICREARAATDSAPLAPGNSVLWDGRFLVRDLSGLGSVGERTVRRFEPCAWSRLTAGKRKGWDKTIPGAVRPGLPAVYDLDGLVAVPHLGFIRRDHGNVKNQAFEAEFRPARTLSAGAFAFAGAKG